MEETIKELVVICSNFTTFAVESPIIFRNIVGEDSCDLLKFHYLCGRITNLVPDNKNFNKVVICSNFTTFAVESPINTSEICKGIEL